MSTATIPAAVPALMTAEEFLKLHGDESGVELVKGRVVRLPMPSLDHGEICVLVSAMLFNFVRAHGLGRVMGNDSFIRTGSDRGSIRGADVCFYSYQRLPKSTPTPRIADVPPELVIEVRSPTDRTSAIRDKINEYLAAGVDVVVLLDPANESATLFRKGSELQLGSQDELMLPDILPEFRVTVDQLFS